MNGKLFTELLQAADKMGLTPVVLIQNHPELANCQSWEDFCNLLEKIVHEEMEK